jgi:CheY-like chemotaxis protein
MVKQTLEKQGYRITARFNGPDALKVLQEQPDQFDLVITDMTMPQMTGDRLARHVWETRPDLPVILCTGYNEMISEDKANAMGIRKFLLKPVDKEELAVAIRSALDSNGTPPYLVPKTPLP